MENYINDEDINLEEVLESLLIKFPGYLENKEDFEKSNPQMFKLLVNYEANVKVQKEIEFMRNNIVDNYDLKQHFGLLTEEEISSQKEVDRLRSKHMNIEYEKYLDIQERKYYDDVGVLLTYDYPYYSAYKIGDSIDDSEYIECSPYINDIYKIIDIFLKTGEKVHDV